MNDCLPSCNGTYRVVSEIVRMRDEAEDDKISLLLYQQIVSKEV